MFRGMGVWAARAANRAPVIRRERIGEDSNSILGNSIGSFARTCRMTGYAEVILILDLPLHPACRRYTQSFVSPHPNNAFARML